MLHYESVEPDTLDILIKLMQIESLKSFNLVGGTALSLKYGHRTSVDLDLFSSADFSNPDVYDSLATVFPNFEVASLINPIGVFGFIGQLKVDLVKYHHIPIIRPVTTIDQIRFFSDEDICAMKLFAILKRGVKKDFFDLSLLLDRYGLQMMIDCYYEKFPNNQMMISIPTALVYYDDAEQTPSPQSLISQTWKQVKMNISKHVNLFLK